MRYLPLISCLLLTACTSPYKKLQAVPGDPDCIQRLKPVFRTDWYTTHVDAPGKQLSGLLLIKAMPDSSTRIVFTSETGLTFFDFVFLPDTGFRVNYIIPQMNKNAVITTLKKDFELILWRNTHASRARVLSDGKQHYYGFPQELLRIEKASSRKPLSEVILQHYHEGIPDTIGITHHHIVHFSIALKRLEK